MNFSFFRVSVLYKKISSILYFGLNINTAEAVQAMDRFAGGGIGFLPVIGPLAGTAPLFLALFSNFNQAGFGIPLGFKKDLLAPDHRFDFFQRPFTPAFGLIFPYGAHELAVFFHIFYLMN